MTTNTQDEGDSWVGVENSSVICCIPKPFPWPRMLVSHFLYPACGLVDHFLYIYVWEWIWPFQLPWQLCPAVVIVVSTSSSSTKF